jgi:hypothetical protein
MTHGLKNKESQVRERKELTNVSKAIIGKERRATVFYSRSFQV